MNSNISINQLKKIAKSIPSDRKADVKIAVLGDTATQLFVTALKGTAFSENIKADVYETEYNQIFPEIINPFCSLSISISFFSHSPSTK